MPLEVIKVMGSEVAINSTPSLFKGAELLRVLNNSAVNGLLTLQTNSQLFQLTINASANGTTLLTLTSNTGNTDGLAQKLLEGYTPQIVLSSNLAVVNTGVSAYVSSVLNSTAFAVNAAVIIANGAVNVYTVDNTYTLTIIANTEVTIAKQSTSFISSNNAATILATPIGFKQ